MTTANVTDSWRRILTQHLRVAGAEGEGDHYPWKVYVNQVTGERTVPESPMTADAGRRVGRALAAGREALAARVREVGAAAARFDQVAPALELLLAVTGGSSSRASGSRVWWAPSWRPRSPAPARRRSSSTPPTPSTATPAWWAPTTSCSPSRSPGATPEVVRFAEMVHARGIPVVAMTGCGGGSPLCELADAGDRHRRAARGRSVRPGADHLDGGDRRRRATRWPWP